MNISDYDSYWMPPQPPVIPKLPGVIVDPTLTLAGEAADARVVGLLLNAYSLQIAGASESVTAIQKELATVNLMILTIKQSGESTNDKIADLLNIKTDLAVLQERVKNQCAAITELKNYTKELPGKYLVLDNKIDETALKLDNKIDLAVHELIDNHIKKIEDRLTILELIGSITPDLNALIERVSALEELTGKIKDALNEHLETINECKAIMLEKIQDLQDQINALNSRVVDVENNYTAIENTVNNISDRLDSAEDKIDSNKLEIDANKQEVDDRIADVVDLVNKHIEQLNSCKEQFGKEIESLKESVESISDELFDENGESKIADLKSKIDELEADVEDITSSIDDVKESVDDLTSRTGALESKTDEIEASIDDLTQKLIDNEAADEELANRVDELESKAANALTGVELNGELAPIDNGIAKLDINVEVIQLVAQYVDASTGVNNFTDALTQLINNAIRDIDGGDLEESKDVNEDMDGGDLG